MIRCIGSALAIALLVSLATGAESTLPYTQEIDRVYADVHGVGLMMDVFTPTGDANGIGIVDIASGAWRSDRNKIRDHQMAQLYTILCGKGYTVFAVRPGSLSKFTGEEMVSHVKIAIRYVKANADAFGIDPDRLGLTGASAGAHLACMAMVTPEDGDPESRRPLRRFDTRVQAVALFFPPTNFLDWNGSTPPFKLIERLLFNDGIEGHSEEEILAKARALSPALHVRTKTPPVLLWHGDADPLVPLQQSQFLAEKLEAVGTDVQLHIKPGGGHPWLTIPEEVAMMGGWFDTQFELE